MTELDEDWHNLSDAATRKRIQNRIAQRNYRRNMRKRLRELEDQVGSKSAVVQQSASSGCAVLSRRRTSQVNDQDDASRVARRDDLSKTSSITQKGRHRRTNTDQTESSLEDLQQSPSDSVVPFEVTYDPHNGMPATEATTLLDTGAFWDLPTPSATPGHPVLSAGWPLSPDALDVTDYFSTMPDTIESDKSLLDTAQDDAVNVAARYMSGQTTLHLAAKKGHLGIVTMLLDRGSSVDDTDILGNSALHAAAAGGHQAIVESLTNRGAAVQLKDACGRTPLHLAAENGHAQTVECLLQHVTEKEIYDALGRTPLHVAIEWGHEDVVRLLLDNGADPTARVSP